jgi:HEAT repeat protein
MKTFYTSLLTCLMAAAFFVGCGGDPQMAADLNALKTESGAKKRDAILHLAGKGKAAHRATPLLIEAFKDEDAGVRRAALEALPVIISSPTQEMTDAIISLTEDPDAGVQTSALQALSALKATDALIEASAKVMQTGAKANRVSACVLLLELKEKAAPATDALIEALGSDDPQLQMHAALALGEIGSPAAKALPALQKVKKTSDEEIAACAASAIKKIGG